MKTIEFRELSKEDQELLGLAEKAAANVFPRDRDTSVGSALRSGEKVFQGANIPRRSFNNSTCAERMALDRALYDGIDQIDKIVTIGLNREKPFTEVVSPCGACRQILLETIGKLGQKDIELILSNSDKSKIIITRLSELLPLGYN